MITDHLGKIMEVDPFIQFLENWMPGIGECTELHDSLHEYFDINYSVNEEAKLLGFQLGHHPAGNILHVFIFCIMSTTIYPREYRNKINDLKTFYRAYLLGKDWQSVSYWFIPKEVFKLDIF